MVFFSPPLLAHFRFVVLFIAHSWSSMLPWDLTRLLLWDMDWRNPNSKKLAMRVSALPLVLLTFWVHHSSQISLAINWAAISVMMLWHQGMWVHFYANGDCYVSLLLEFLFPLNGISSGIPLFDMHRIKK